MSSDLVEDKTEELNYQKDAQILSKQELDNKKKAIWIKLADDTDEEDLPHMHVKTFDLIRKMRQKNNYDTKELLIQVKKDLITRLFQDFNTTSLSKTEFCKQLGFVDFVPKKMLKICPELSWIFDHYIYSEADTEDFVRCIKLPKITDDSVLEKILKNC